jgi:hypothetical protein
MKQINYMLFFLMLSSVSWQIVAMEEEVIAQEQARLLAEFGEQNARSDAFAGQYKDNDDTLIIDPSDVPEEDNTPLIPKKRQKGIDKKNNTNEEKKVEPTLNRDEKEEKSELSLTQWFGIGFGSSLLAGIFYLLFVQKSSAKQADKFFNGQ